MKPPIRILLLALVIGAAALAQVGATIPQPDLSPSLENRRPDPDHGRRVALQGDCAGCHTAANGAPLAGGVAFGTPVGTLYSSNITPDPETGIGAYSFSDFVRLMRFGVAPGGKRIYPAMPYTAYAKVSDEDLQDLFAFLRQRVEPVRQPTRSGDIAWPLSMRWPLALWNMLFHDPHRFTPDPTHNDAWNRGAYLVQGLAHCGTCHTPRNAAYAEKDLDGGETWFLSGSGFDGAAPINLRANDGDGLGRWSAADIALLLKTGRNAHSAASGPMTEIISRSTSHLDESDLAAIAVYLKSLSPAPGNHAEFTPDASTLKNFLAGTESSVGGRIFMDSCAACHRLTGRGGSTTFPDLAGNPSVLSQDPSSLIGVILAGSRLPSTVQAPSPLAMPGFAWRYDDADIAALASFVRASWGNHAPAVTPGQVSEVRAHFSLH